MLKSLFVLSLAAATFAAGHGIVATVVRPETSLITASDTRNSTIALWWNDGTTATGAAGTATGSGGATTSGADGFVSLDHGQPKWSESYDEKIEAGSFDGVRWRLGQNHWTVLDTNVALTFGEVEVPAGSYYVVLERARTTAKGTGVYRAFLLDPAKIRETGLLAFQAQRTEGGIEIPFTYEEADDVSDKLVQEFAAAEARGIAGDEQGPDAVLWTIHFGGHLLKTTFGKKG